ncbi:MAG: L-threonylcarbamoyladenylate synthase [Verrucomicrobiota bacterium]
MTQILPSRTPEERAKAVASATAFLRRGDPVALPTETVYGLAADALNSIAVAKIFEVKERPRFDPLIVHLPDRSWLERVARIDHQDRHLILKLIDCFWPGPLTFVLPRQSIIPDIVTAGLDTVAVRISAHPLFAEIIREFGGPLAAPSANRFGRISPTTGTHVIDELDGRIPLVVDAGPTEHGIESTIVAIRNDRIELLRRGPISAEQLSEFGNVVVSENNPRVEAPGQSPSHYAPRTPLVIVEDVDFFVAPKKKRCGLLAWSSGDEPAQFATVRSLTSRKDLREAASNLFRCLRELDHENLDLIVAEKIPEEGLGCAIMDRLRRASTR